MREMGHRPDVACRSSSKKARRSKSQSWRDGNCKPVARLLWESCNRRSRGRSHQAKEIKDYSRTTSQPRLGVRLGPAQRTASAAQLRTATGTRETRRADTIA